MKTDNIFFALIAALLLTASCASEDATQTGEHNQEQKTKNYTVFVSGKEDTSTEQPKTRTSLNYNTGAFYWETGDNIFVKDDGGTWQTGSNVVNGTQQARYRFQVPGAFANTSYAVYYPGKNGTNDQVTISTEQTQTAPADTKHFGEAGDCGLGTATAVSDGFFFKLDHKAAYLIFQPYNTNAELEDCYITQIEVTSNGTNIAGTYTISSTGLTEVSGSNKIKLTTKGTGSYANGFPLNNTAVKFSTNAAYMVIAPGTHALTVTYTVKDYTTEVEGTITRQLPAFNYEGNTYYDMTCNFNITNYTSQQYYRWGAKNHYWYGYEQYQPHNNGEQNNYYPGGPGVGNQMNDRDYDHGSTGTPTSPARYDAKADAFGGMQGIPNVNELCWYVMKGDPHWITDRIFAQGGHLVKLNGIWLKKKSAIVAYLKDQEGYPATLTWEQMKEGYQASATASITDFRVNRQSLTGTTSTGNPSNLTDYFFLPAFGFYGWGKLSFLGSSGYFWSSSSDPQIQGTAYSMFISNANVGVANSDCSYGFCAQPFE